jgi:alkylation response protein AidB-like acyl-CoA dehydrogenase
MTSNSAVATGAGVLERTRELVPLLRENAQKTDRDRRLPAENLTALADAGVFRITLPRRFGGYELPTTEQVDVLAEVARGCGSTSWVAAVHSVGTWIVALFPDETQDEVFAIPDVRVTVVGSPTGVATPVSGGYRVTGKWAFNTGALDAHWAYAGAVREGESLPEGHLGVLMPYEELELHDDWYVTGLRGTGSCSVSAHDVFVPELHVLPMPYAMEGRYLSERNADIPLYRAAFGPFIAANSAGTPLGLGRAALEAFLERLPGRPITFTEYTDRRDAPITHLQVGEAAIRLESAQYHAHRCAAIVDAKAAMAKELTIEERARVRMDLAWVTELARTATRLLQEGSGATSIHEDVPIQRIARDIEALALHAILHPKTNLELYGRVLCGLEPKAWLV